MKLHNRNVHSWHCLHIKRRLFYVDDAQNKHWLVITAFVKDILLRIAYVGLLSHYIFVKAVRAFTARLFFSIALPASIQLTRLMITIRWKKKETGHGSAASPRGLLDWANCTA